MIHALLSPALAASLLFPARAPVADIFVDQLSPSCATGTGTAMNPVCSINAAIAIASPGDTIRIAPGTYTEEFTLPFDLDLVGTSGSAATEISGAGQNPTRSTITVPAAVNSTISGVTIRDGRARYGGGIFVGGSLTLTESNVQGNEGDLGGGLSTRGAPGATLNVLNCIFESNSTPYATSRGGAIDLLQAQCTITDSIFRNNESYAGGAVYFMDTAAGNRVLNINRSTIESNTSDELLSGGDGGGIYQRNGQLLLTNSTIAENHARQGNGGGLSLDGVQFSISNSTIADNQAVNFQFFTAQGGGIAVLNSSGSISSTTITENSSDRSGGIAGSGSTINIDNSIVAGNFASDPIPPNFSRRDVTVPLNSLGFNVIGAVGLSGIVDGVNGDQAGSIAALLDPELGPLQDLGGPTRTNPLLTGSPALDAGDLGSFEPTDQRGFSRPQGGRPDVGAFELVADAAEYCNGDGGDGAGCTPCPCGNDAALGIVGGCLHSGGAAGRLVRSGSSSVPAQDLRIEARSLTSNTAAILLSGAALAPNNAINPCFGSASGITSPTLDGLRCIVGDILRHGVRPADSNGDIGLTTNGWGTPNGFFNLGAFVAGQTRNFQITYRDDLAAQCMTGLNTTQAAQVTFVP